VSSTARGRSGGVEGGAEETVFPIRLYSFEEVVGLLNDPHPRMDFKPWPISGISEDELRVISL
jgi:hypothetical protein